MCLCTCRASSYDPLAPLGTQALPQTLLKVKPPRVSSKPARSGEVVWGYRSLSDPSHVAKLPAGHDDTGDAKFGLYTPWDGISHEFSMLSLVVQSMTILKEQIPISCTLWVVPGLHSAGL